MLREVIGKSTEQLFKYAYTGSFDPWTKGHQSVVESFLRKDPDANVEIIIGKNPGKKNQLLTESDRAFVIIKGISEEFQSRIKVTIFEGVIADYMYEQNIPYFIRGVRDEKDYREEIDLAQLNSQLFGSPMTLLIPQVEASLSDVSSSNFKLLGNLGIPMDRYANAFTRELMKMKTTEKLFIGVTGGVASGKSTFCKKLTEFSEDQDIQIQTINMDALGHIVLETKEPILLFIKARKQIAKLFGDSVLEPDGTISRQKLGEEVFGNAQKLDTLTNLLSEPILYLLAKEIRSAKKGIVFIESAILIERNITELVDDNIIHVHTNAETQIERMKEKRGLTSIQAKKRINSQSSAKEIKDKIRILQNSNFDRLYFPVDTSEQLTNDDISEIYQQLISEYHRRKEVRRTDELFIPGDILVKDEDTFFSELSSYYSHSDRGYHNLKHIKEMLNCFQRYKIRFTNPNEVYLAILLHDVIYDVSKKDNEHQSALVAEQFINRHIENDDINIDLVKQLIELTALHAEDISGIDEEAKIFLDIDMVILAASRKRLHEYENGIFKEYSKLYSKDVYITGRRDFLKSVLGKDTPIYLSKLFQEQYEDTARKNIVYLLSQLAAAEENNLYS